MEAETTPKLSLCRFYVRGLCIYPKQQCVFAHGIDDLDYRPWREGQPIEFDYLQDTNFCQKKAKKGPRIYINLYQFQPVKRYTLDQLNSDRPLRVEVRAEMHKKLFNDFIELIEATYKGANLTEDMLMREYTRVGFNKLMTRIKFSHLTNVLCEGDQPKYYLKALTMPPLIKRQQNFIFKRVSEEEIINCYRNEYKQLLQLAGQTDQAIIKKHMFRMEFPSVGIPPLNLILKEKKISFTEFLAVLNGGQLHDLMGKIRLEPSVEELVEAALKWLQEEGKSMPGWTQLFTYLSKIYKINNGNLLNQVKPYIVLRGYWLIYFPMLQFIMPRQNGNTNSSRICDCPFKEEFDLSEFAEEWKSSACQLKEGQSVDIFSWETLQANAYHIMSSTILGVDLQGKLQCGGFVQMLQLNNSKNTFLIDFYQMQCKEDTKTIEVIKRIVRNLMVNQNITKIFHDCRNDSLAIHQLLGSCVLNVFDTSAVETLKGQIQAYSQLKVKHPEALSQAKNVISECANVKTVGLNQIYKRYKASHGINIHKQRFHKMWSQGIVDFFLQRPIDPDYRDYCIRDVLDLHEVYANMTKGMEKKELELAKLVSAHYVSIGYVTSIKFQ